MLKPLLLTALMMIVTTPSWAQSGMSVISESAAGVSASSTARDMFGAPPGGMMVSEPLAGPAVSAISILEDDGVPYLPVEDLCATVAAASTDQATAYADCIGAETEAYDRILSGLPGYEPGLMASCDVATRSGGEGYLTLLSCLGSPQD
jgi:hypothetical protein